MERGGKRQLEEESWPPSRKHPKLGPMLRFEPTDAELVAYLEMVIRSEHVLLPEGIIHSANVYGHHPQTLTGMYSPAHDVRMEWYFFTPREAKYPNGLRPDRRAGNNGFWKATGGVQNIVRDDHVVGRKKSLVFYESLPGQKKQRKTKWIMHEYEHVSNNAQFQSWVLCRIRHNGKQHPPAEEAAQPPADALDPLLEVFQPVPLCVAAPDGSYWKHMPALVDAAAAAVVHETTWGASSPSRSGATTAPAESQYPACHPLDSAETDFLDCDFDGGLMVDMMSYLLDD
ncbi:hypothetical protein H6P81_005047 [Aristolochia fimbriata]|uniref:NAC domain-containing protein n=1 Tax=Aristolochia fimbriata TaxID=158543 RepID=A0AAV7ETV7_ARIFI|nr:hypothetical protein H6P81_005047 [Aristolochia fimbriata]